MSIRIQINGERAAFRPGETIEGMFSWSLPVAPTHIALELFWTTRGKGKIDSEVVESVHVNHPAASGEQSFGLKIPNGPYSFSGKLVTLLWGLRLVILPSQEQAQVNLTISPTGQEINLVG